MAANEELRVERTLAGQQHDRIDRGRAAGCFPCAFHRSPASSAGLEAGKVCATDAHMHSRHTHSARGVALAALLVGLISIAAAGAGCKDGVGGKFCEEEGDCDSDDCDNDERISTYTCNPCVPFATDIGGSVVETKALSARHTRRHNIQDRAIGPSPRARWAERPSTRTATALLSLSTS